MISASAAVAPHRVRSAALTRFIAVVSAVGAAVIAHSLWVLPSTPNAAAWIGVGTLALLAGSFALKVPGVDVHVSISDTFFITLALLFGPAPATLAIALDSLVMSLRRRQAVNRVLFNTTSTAISVWIAAQVFFALARTAPLFDAGTPLSATTILPLTCLAVVYFGLNSGLTAAALAMDKGVPALALWRRHFAVLSLNYFAAASAAFVLIVLVKYVSMTAVAALVPMLVIFYLATRSWLGRIDDAERHVEKVNRLHLSTVSALSTAIEAKDGVTSDHIHRVQAYALGLAKALNITDPATLQALEAAALLHDTGKLAVPEHILNKPGRLTPAEFETMKSHVDVGADILSAIEFPYPVVPIVRAHHENWDGTGYPRRLCGEEIPIGARILSVVDCFDALTSDRPYRSAMAESDAIAIILERRGTMYDPDVVDTFVRVYRDIALDLASQPQLQSAVHKIRGAHKVQESPVAAAHAADTASAASEDVLAFVSLARLATRTPTIGDIGALAWSHLRHLAPGASLALFTVDSARGVLTVQYSAGPAANRVNRLVINVSERISGWVAATWRPMVNAEARLDLGAGTADDLQYAMALPLVSDGVLVGVLTLYASAAFTDDGARSLEAIAPHLATSVAAVDIERTRAARPELRVISRR